MKKKRTLKKIRIIILVLLLVLLVLILINLKVWKYFEKREIKMIPLADKCSILMNNLIHSIKDSSGCENYCRSECLTLNMNFYKSDFSANLKGCNTCDCYCKQKW